MGLNVIAELDEALTLAKKTKNEIAWVNIKFEIDNVLIARSKGGTGANAYINIVTLFKNISYDDYSGLDPLSGVIVFNDGSWLERININEVVQWGLKYHKEDKR